MKLQHRVALITGGGSGIGRAIAQLFNAEGACVVVNDIDLETAQQTIAGMSAPERAIIIRADVSCSSQVTKMFSQIEEHFNRLDILINNAGIAETASKMATQISLKARSKFRDLLTESSAITHWDITQNLTDEDWNRMLGTHLNGTFFCTREALKIMAKKNSGAIVNMSAVAALTGLEMSPHYAAAKGGILSFTRSVAREVASRNIRVNAICPGWVNTPMIDSFPQRFRAFTTLEIPLHRWAEPKEIAQTALFLASDDSSYFTGQTLSPNGGLFTG